MSDNLRNGGSRRPGVGVSLARRALSGADGATAAEFALALPIFVMMLLGVVEFGWTQHSLSTTRYAMERAARDLMINPQLTESQLQARVTAELEGKTDAKVDLKLKIVDGPAGKIGTLTGVYIRKVSVPMLPAYPISHTIKVETSLSA